jgi:hypothetical protein
MDDQTGSKIVATHGRGDGLYLIQRADGQGQVADTSRGMLLPPRPMDSFLDRTTDSATAPRLVGRAHLYDLGGDDCGGDDGHRPHHR